MALVFQDRLAIPLWTIAFFTVALTARQSAPLFLTPLTTVFAGAAIGIGAILFLTPGAMTCLRGSPSLVRVRNMAGPSATEADDALRLAAMDDDGGGR